MFIGSTVAILCYSIEQPKWTKNGKPVRTHTIVNNYLILENVDENDSGYYFCYGTLDFMGTIFQNYSQVLVGGILNCT